MICYDIAPEVEAFSTNIGDSLDFDVILPHHQQHSSLVRRVPEEIDSITGVDALITAQHGVRIGVKTADCVPVLLYDSAGEAIGVIHSGWKGTLQNIIRESIRRMRAEFGTKPEDLKAVIGPCIHLKAFEVGEELADAFRGEMTLENYPFAKHLPHPVTGLVKWHLDLPGICNRQLLDEGVLQGNIEKRPECTWEMHDEFYSARWLGKQFGKQRIFNCIMLK